MIELVVVILILGVLSATALPKFIDLSDDARRAEAEAVYAAAAEAANMNFVVVKLGKAGYTPITSTAPGRAPHLLSLMTVSPEWQAASVNHITSTESDWFFVVNLNETATLPVRIQLHDPDGNIVAVNR